MFVLLYYYGNIHRIPKSKLQNKVHSEKSHFQPKLFHASLLFPFYVTYVLILIFGLSHFSNKGYLHVYTYVFFTLLEDD